MDVGHLGTVRSPGLSDARGIHVDDGSAPATAAADPDEAERLRPLVMLYEEEQFSPRQDAERRRRLRKLLAEMKARTA